MIRARRQKRTMVSNKRNEILSAAIEVFARKGYNKASISDVATIAGVASGTVYIYFKNKDDLLLQAMKTVMDTSLAEIRNKIESIDNPAEKLFQFFFHHIELFRTKPSMARFLMMELRQSEEFYKLHPTYNPYSDYRKYIEDLVTHSIRNGFTKSLSPSTLSYVILGFMDNMITEWLLHPDKVDLEKSSWEFREIMISGTRTHGNKE